MDFDQSHSLLSAESVSLLRQGRKLLDSVDFDLQVGEVVALLGPNGAGKTTLLNVLNGQLKPDSGAVALLNRSLAQWPLAEKAKYQASLAQQSPLNFPYRVQDVVALGRLPHASGQQFDQNCVAAAMAATDVEHLSDHVYTLLSGGEKQRVQLARVFAQLWPQTEQQTPAVLLLDEPTSSLDLAHQQMVLHSCVERSQQQASVLLVLHDINLALRFCDRLVLMSTGKIIAAGRPQEVAKPELIQQVFGIKAEIIQHPIHNCPHVVF